MRHILFFLVFSSVSGFSQNTSTSPASVKSDRPKLVVGIVVDQMRQEYLYRYAAKFGNDGFKRLMKDGFMLKNAHYNYSPTVTGPGHASIYTGSTPSIHGIIGNEFYDKESKKMVNCVGDPSVKPVGNLAGAGLVSPWRMLTTTITDQLKIFTQKKAKVIGISIKDRGAVLPAGHMADAAYWYDKQTGKFISSTYYMAELPAWVNKFNNLNLADQYLSQEWKTLLPINEYTESWGDESPFEGKFEGKPKSVFPYDLKSLRKTNGNFDLLTTVPFGNDYVTEFAKAALLAEKMGADAITDFLCISYSTTDILGHKMGPQAIEVQDMYMRLDKNIADLLKKLDEVVGQNNYTVFLTSDHGVAEIPQHMKENKVPAGYFSAGNATALLKDFLKGYFPEAELIDNVSNNEVFLNHAAFQGAPKSAGVDMLILSELIGKFMMTQPGVANYYTEGMLRQGRYDEGGIRGMIIRGHHAKRSGDVVLNLEPAWYTSSFITGTTHGSAYTYDTHVPIIFYGHGIKKGSSVRYHAITSIAPTLSMLLNISLPNGSTGTPVEELFE